MKKLPVKVISAALAFATVLSASACNKKETGESSGAGIPETSRRGQKISADSPWYESSTVTFVPQVQSDKKPQTINSDVVAADDKYILVRSTGNYPIPDNFDWSKYSSKDMEISLITVVDRNSKQVLNTIDLTKNYTNSCYVNNINYSDGKIGVVLTNYDAVNDIPTCMEISYDAASGKELGKKELSEAANNGGKTYKIGDYSVSASMNWYDFEFYTLTITAPDGSYETVDLSKPGKNVYDLYGILPLDDNKALVPASIESEKAFFELDLKAATLTEVDAKSYDWINTTYLYNSFAASDGMVYYTAPVGIAKIDMKNKTCEQVFNYSWCNENRNKLSYLSICDCSEDSFLLCGGSGYGSAYSASSVQEVSIVELTKAKTNPNAGKTIMELYVPYGYVNEKIADAIITFNSTNADYFIEVSGRYTDDEAYDYNTQINSDDDMRTVTLNGDAKISNKLAMDILNGEGPDILMNVANYSQLNTSNYLADLTKYIGTLDSEKYFTNIVDADKVNGQLYQLTLCYGVEGIQTDKKYAGASGVGFTTEEYKKYLNEQLNGKDIIPSGQAIYFTKLFNAMSDKFLANGKADFSGPEFAALAEFVKENVQERAKNWNDPVTDDGPAYAVGALTFKGDQMISGDQNGIYTECYGIGSYFYNIAQLKGGSAILGLPSADGRGPMFIPHVSVAVSAQAINTDACGEFVKLLLSEDIQESLAQNDEFVLSRTAYRKVAQQAVDYYNGAGRGNIFDVSDPANKKNALTFSQDNIDEMEKIISSCSRSNSCDAAINLILIEEMPAYFLGQKDLNSVVAIAQDRVQKVLSERG